MNKIAWCHKITLVQKNNVTLRFYFFFDYRYISVVCVFFI